VAVTSWVGYTQLDPSTVGAVGVTVASRTWYYQDWMSGEMAARGFTVAWTSSLPYYLKGLGLPPNLTPTPLDLRPIPTKGQGWPR
jgi:hypothetical protein